MTPPQSPIALKMVRKDLENIPDFAFPPGFLLRAYRPGDAERWTEIQLLADELNEITGQLFGQQFGYDNALLAQRQLYTVDAQGEAIGTGTAWFNDHFEGARWGRVHWVAIRPAYQGRGLAKPLMTALCRRLRELGHTRAYLSTSSARRAAINLYRRFGFEPFIKTDEERVAWQKLADLT
jgi:GNAT superfamily N-acetyltransferase